MDAADTVDWLDGQVAIYAHSNSHKWPRVAPLPYYGVACQFSQTSRPTTLQNMQCGSCLIVFRVWIRRLCGDCFIPLNGAIIEM